MTLWVVSPCLILAIIGKRSCREAGGVGVVQLMGHVVGPGRAEGSGGWKAWIVKKSPGTKQSTCAGFSFAGATGLGFDLQTSAR